MATKNTKTNGSLNKADFTNITSKADAIRKVVADHPEWTRTKTAEELTKVGFEVTAGRVSGVLRQSSSSKGAGTLDADALKKAAEFVDAFGDVGKALAAIESVEAFIDSCGNSKKAHGVLADLKTVRELQAI